MSADMRQTQFHQLQAVNAKRAVAALRPFRPNEFGSTAASPGQAHLDAANRLIGRLQKRAFGFARRLPAEKRPLTQQARALYATKSVEKVWEFYLELFGQRQTRFGTMLLACDRIALDCYQAVYTGLDKARPIPSPPPFSYMETGFTPATFRRGVVLTSLGRRANPFPLVGLPYRRLVNPWSLGAVHHEVAHNLQSDLGMWQIVPKRIVRRLRKANVPAGVAATWARWHKEVWADLCGVLLGGPPQVRSLMGVVARPAHQVVAFNPDGVHPTPYLRVLINTELLRRMGFSAEARQLQKSWLSLYPKTLAQQLPAELRRTFGQVGRLVVDEVCYQPYRELGNKPLAEVVPFKAAFRPMMDEAARRLASGNDPGIIPARFLVGAARYALERNYARPKTVTDHFYQALRKR